MSDLKEKFIKAKKALVETETQEKNALRCKQLDALYNKISLCIEEGHDNFSFSIYSLGGGYYKFTSKDFKHIENLFKELQGLYIVIFADGRNIYVHVRLRKPYFWDTLYYLFLPCVEK